MLKSILLGLFLCFCTLLDVRAQTSTMLQEVIVDYTDFNKSILLSKNRKVIEVTLPKDAREVFYRITTFNTEKVNLDQTLFEALRLVAPGKLKSPNYDLTPHTLTSNATAGVETFFFAEQSAAERFKEGSDVACKKIDATQSTIGRLEATCQAEKLYVGFKATNKQPITVKLEIVAFAPVAVNASVDKYLYTIENQTDRELAYEISGNRVNWEAFYLPAARKAEFRLADTPVYLRVSTQNVKNSLEYQLWTEKQYRLFWNDEKRQVDLVELPKK
jgi:hypothetical protein